MLRFRTSLIAVTTLALGACTGGGYDGPVATFDRGGASFDYPAEWELEVTSEGDCGDPNWGAGVNLRDEGSAFVVFCPGSFGSPATNQEQVREQLEGDYVSDDEITWEEVRDPSDEEMDDLYGIVADGDAEFTPEEYLLEVGPVGPVHVRQYLGVA